MNRSNNHRFQSGESVMTREASFLWANTDPAKRRNIRLIAEKAAAEMGLTLPHPRPLGEREDRGREERE